MSTEGERPYDPWLLQAVNELSDAIILVLDVEGRIVSVNGLIEKIAGYRPDEVRGKDWFATFLPKRDQDRIRRLFKTSVHEDVVGNINPIVTRSGDECEIEWYSTPLRGERGEFKGILAVGHDVTERVRVERRARALEARVEGLLATVGEGVLFVDGQGRITQANDKAAELFGFEGIHDLVGLAVDSLGISAAGPGASGTTTAIHAKTGHEIPVHVAVARVGDAQQVILLEDATERVKRGEQDLSDARWNAVGTTAAMFVHEVGNPLYSVQLHAQALDRAARAEPPRIDEIRSSLQACQSELARMRDLIDEYRAIAPLRAHEFEPVPIDDLLDDLLFTLAPLLAANRVRLVRAREPDAPSVSADRRRLEQVFVNLLKNAVEAMPDGGELEVHADAHKGSARIRISDTGVGVPEGIDPYEPFRTSKLDGTGLGLPLCRKILFGHRGKLEHEAREAGGTTFTVTLPLDAAPMAAHG
jgi:PAS domain S-box-containing protein